MEIIADGSGDGIALPFPTSFARDAPFVERPRNRRRSHSVVFYLPGHVVNDALFKPIWYEHSITVDIPSKNGLGSWLPLFAQK